VRTRLSLLILLAALAAGCATAPITAEPPPDATYPHHSLEQILFAMEDVASRDSLLAYSSQARLAMRSPEQNADGTATIRQRGGDTLWASVRGPLNIEVARALVTADSFHFHDRLRNRLYLGPAEAAQQLFPGPADTHEAFRSITGTLLPDPSVRWYVNASTVDGHDVYWLTAPDGRLRIAVDPRVWRVRRYERLAAGAVVDRRLYGEFSDVDGRVLPHSIELSDPSSATFLNLEHRRLTLNPPTLAFPFDPAGATPHPIAGPLFGD
jgi:hypothetical protein